MSLYQILRDSVSGQRIVDDKAVEAKILLGEKLSMLGKFNPVFADVCFSPDVENIEMQEPVAIA